MSTATLTDMAEQLQSTGLYRVIRKYEKPLYYNQPKNNNEKKLIGVFLDIEATGLLYSQDKLIELGMVKFEYSEDGRIFSLLEEFNAYCDPGFPIPPHITKLTGITDDMVKDQVINEDEVAEYLQNTDLIIAHNAQFDRAFLEMSFPNIPPRKWACSMWDINRNMEAYQAIN